MIYQIVSQLLLYNFLIDLEIKWMARTKFLPHLNSQLSIKQITNFFSIALQKYITNYPSKCLHLMDTNGLKYYYETPTVSIRSAINLAL